MFMGLGDIVIPGALVASAFVWLPGHPLRAGDRGQPLDGAGRHRGSLVGYALLMRAAMTGNPQAGLPFLNGGALGGYILAYLLLFHSFGLGFTLTL